MRHNAHIRIICEGSDPFNIYLDSCGNPAQVKLLARNAMRGIRRELKYDPERFALRLVQLSRFDCPRLVKYADSYLWLYRFNLSDLVPSVTIIRLDQKLREKVGLFRWAGREGAYVKQDEIKVTPKSHLPGRRGRRSELSKDGRLRAQLMPAPDHIDSATGMPVFYNNRRNRNA